ncbi:DNA polymerase Y family protein [Aquincola sp. S2]|uniref:DNA polymerase Y family protein n=1 Tax=Pseudaquabacterium terrae TaxID=2732868 RepID=A0ABX2EJD9_9BURK|nr:DNA polymerase Y family protein [Aquabacterium terrae]NRF68775.1 DNA polymerase Y family protein [Aquabacterium terrae]
MLWIGLHLPWLSLETFCATLAALPESRPIALVEDGRIVQADAAARALGIRPGLKRPTALALSADLLLGQADPHRDAIALQSVAQAALAFTPAVTLADHAATIQLEVQASLRYFGGLTRLIDRLQQALAPLQHRLQLATAPTARGAALLARWRAGFELGPHSTDLAQLCRLLDDAPVWLLGPGREHWDALQGMGLRTLADLRALPRSGVARRFSPELLEELDQARGRAPEPQRWIVAPPQFHSRLELFARADRSEQVIAGAHILLARLVAWAQAQHGRIGRFSLLMHHEPRHRADDRTPPTTCLEIEPALPSADAAHLQMLLAERLGRLPLVAPALELSLHSETLVPGAAPNAELFPTRASERAGLTRLIERLQARLGREAVRALALARDHRPERATVSQPLNAARAGAPPVADAAISRLMAQALADAAGDVLSRPAWLLPDPLPLAQRDGRPLLNGQPLLLLAGPERIETGWWDEDLVLRDYYVAGTADGALVWLFRPRLAPIDEDDSWFLQGRFA